MAFDLRNTMARPPQNQWAGYSDYFKNMMSDPSMLGYSPEVLNAMRGVSTGAITGAKRSAIADVDRQVAAQGMGNTGMGIRMAGNLGNQAMVQQREANRDIDLENAEAQKRDFWQASQGWGQGIQGQQQAQTADATTDLNRQQVGNQGFWGTVKRNLANLIGRP